MAELAQTSLFSDANLVSYWRMEGNSNDTKDSNNGTDTTITYSAGNGMFGQGAGLNGTSSYIAIANAANLQITGALTIVGWGLVSDTTPNKQMAVFSKGNINSPAAVDYYLGFNSRKVQGIVSDGTTANNLTGNTAATDLSWHHLAVTYTPSGNLTVYLDGAQDGQAGGSIASIQSTTHAAAMGRDGTLAQIFWGNNLDDIAIFNRALLATEIQQLFSLGQADYSYIM